MGQYLFRFGDCLLGALGAPAASRLPAAAAGHSALPKEGLKRCMARLAGRSGVILA
ncbi:hypothetical protein BVIET440_10344 [Burkholderia vietnamiensis]|nr:hypothetical protein BVI1335_2420003 [Burkholderia vietnamiensis]CAG9215451.1 hypothetical protein BVI2075_600018 [Burkholderia vietnamiensis]